MDYKKSSDLVGRYAVDLVKHRTHKKQLEVDCFKDYF